MSEIGAPSAIGVPAQREPVEMTAALDEESDRVALRLAIDAAGVGAFVWDLVSGRLRWDERLLELFGLDESSFGGTIEAFNEFVHPDDLPRVSAGARARDRDPAASSPPSTASCCPAARVRWIEARGRAFSETARRPGGAPRGCGLRHQPRCARARPGSAGSSSRCRPRSTSWTPTGGSPTSTPRRSGSSVPVARTWWASRSGRRSRQPSTVPSRRIPRRRGNGAPRVVRGLLPTAPRRLVRGPRLAGARGPRRLLRRHLRPPRGPGRTGPVGAAARPPRRGVRGAHQHPGPARARAPARHPARPRPGGLVPGHPGRRPARPRLASWAPGRRLGPRRPGDARDGAGVLRPPPARHDRRVLPRADHPRDDVHQDGVRRRRPGRRRAPARSGARPAARARPRVGRGGARCVARGRTVGVVTVFRGPAAAPSTRTTSPCSRTSAPAPHSHSTTPGSTRPSATSPRPCSAACSPTRRSPTTCEIVTRYSPASDVARIGGDWYDAFLQQNRGPGGNDVVVVVGDVVGHDVEAAAAMGQVRGLLRGIAVHSGYAPAAILSGVDEVMQSLRLETTATAVVARLEHHPRPGAAAGEEVVLRWAHAGHPPALARTPGRNRHPARRRGGQRPPAGARSPTPEARRAGRLPRAGHDALFYTDGLVERRDRDVEEGIESLDRDPARPVARHPRPRRALRPAARADDRRPAGGRRRAARRAVEPRDGCLNFPPFG